MAGPGRGKRLIFWSNSNLGEEVLLGILMKGGDSSLGTKPGINSDLIFFPVTQAAVIGDANVLLQLWDLVKELVLSKVSNVPWLIHDVSADELTDGHEGLGPFLISVPGAHFHWDSSAASNFLDILQTPLLHAGPMVSYAFQDHRPLGNQKMLPEILEGWTVEPGDCSF